MTSSGASAGDQRPEVILLGDLNIDLHLDIPAYPAPGGDGVASGQRIGFGGSAANTAVMLSRLGVRTALLACVGDDAWGAQAISGLAAQGVDATLVQQSSIEPTSLNIIAVTPDGERTMFAYRGASTQLAPESVPAHPGTARHLHLSGYALLTDPQRSAAFAAATRARRAGVTVSLDVPVDPVTAVPDVLTGLLSEVDVVVISSAEARRLTGTVDDQDAAERIAGHGPSVVAVTGGAAGSLLRYGQRSVRAPVPAVRAVDTTGAGDSFCAGLIFGLLRGVPDPEQVAAIANVCGAAAAAGVGAGAGLPHAGDLLAVVEALPEPLRASVIDVLAAGGAIA